MPFKTLTSSFTKPGSHAVPYSAQRQLPNFLTAIDKIGTASGSLFARARIDFAHFPHARPSVHSFIRGSGFGTSKYRAASHLSICTYTHTHTYMYMYMYYINTNRYLCVFMYINIVTNTCTCHPAQGAGRSRLLRLNFAILVLYLSSRTFACRQDRVCIA